MLDFGYVFCRVMHFYGLSDRHVLDMPIRRFWLLVKNINRISAERDMRTLTVTTVAAQGNDEARKSYRSQLILEMGTVVKGEDKLDREGWAELKRMAGQRVRG